MFDIKVSVCHCSGQMLMRLWLALLTSILWAEFISPPNSKLTVSLSIRDQYLTFYQFAEQLLAPVRSHRWVAACVDVWLYIPPIQCPLAEVLVGGEGCIMKVFVRIKWLDEPREISPTSMGWYECPPDLADQLHTSLLVKVAHWWDLLRRWTIQTAITRLLTNVAVCLWTAAAALLLSYRCIDLGPTFHFTHPQELWLTIQNLVCAGSIRQFAEGARETAPSEVRRNQGARHLGCLLVDQGTSWRCWHHGQQCWGLSPIVPVR